MRTSSSEYNDQVKPGGAATNTLVDQLVEVIDEAIPRLRGWLHLTAVPLALAAGVLLICLSPTGTPRTGATVFVACALVLFSVSAALHRRRWTPSAGRVVTRLDHASIFLLIAGSYTPFGLLLLGASLAVLAGVLAGRRRANQVFAEWSQLASVFAVLLPMLVYVGGIALAGIYASSAVLIGYFMRRHGRFGWRATAAVAAGVPLVLFMVFERWFLVPLPKGPIERMLGF